MTAQSGLAGRRVLVVEDEFFLADEMASLLRSVGATVLGPAGTVESALQMVRDQSPDFAILDISLRGAKVFPVAEALEAAGVRFVFATGYDADSIPPRFAAVPCWEKPVDPERLADLQVA